MINFSKKYPIVGSFYYHYKHDDQKSLNNYSYKIIGIAVHSETEEILVAYQPLYRPNHVFDYEANFNVRPLDMFLENVIYGDYSGARFRLITDEKTIAELNKLDFTQI